MLEDSGWVVCIQRTVSGSEGVSTSGMLSVSGLSTLASVDINGGTINGAAIGSSSPAVSKF